MSTAKPKPNPRSHPALASIYFADDLAGVDWELLKADLQADDFDNGRSPAQLRKSFANSYAVCMARLNGRVVGVARVLSDGVCNAYLVDVWTQSAQRHHGIATEMIRRLSTRLTGQHLYLQADEPIAGFYRKLGFADQPAGLSRIIGRWLNNDR